MGFSLGGIAKAVGLSNPAVAGTALGAASQIGGQYLANEANAKQAELNRRFQERMSSTAYQRAMADMRKAGLNPMLAYAQGGASSPGGGQAQARNIAEGFVSNVQGAIRMNQELQNMESQKQNTDSLTNLNNAKTVIEASKAGKAGAFGSIWNEIADGVKYTIKNAPGFFESSSKQSKELSDAYIEQYKKDARRDRTAGKETRVYIRKGQ